MLSLIGVVCILGFNINKVDTFTAEDATFAFEIFDDNEYKNNGSNEKSKLRFENNLDIGALIPKQLHNINEFKNININVYEFPEDISMKPCKYRDKYLNSKSVFKYL